jgi:hypothetical protein
MKIRVAVWSSPLTGRTFAFALLRRKRDIRIPFATMALLVIMRKVRV